MICKQTKRTVAGTLILFSLALLLGCTGQGLENDATLRGHVYDATGTALSQATITVTSSAVQAETDSDGAYVLQLENGSYEVAAEKAGFTKRALSIVVDETETEVNFTLQPKSAQESLTMLLDSGDENYTTQEDVAFALTIVNDYSYPITISSYGFTVKSATNEVLWEQTETPPAALTLGAGQSTTLNGTWQWTTNTPSISPNASVDCYGFVTLAGETNKRETLKLPVELLSFTPKPEILAFDTVEQGADSPVRTLRTTVIRNDTDWQTFWNDHGNGSTRPAINFTQSMIIAAMGGEIENTGSHVAVLALEHLPGANEITCRLSRLYPTGQGTQATTTEAPYHIIVTAARTETVNFVWEQLDLGP